MAYDTSKLASLQALKDTATRIKTVSYTHLTLPTIA